MAITRVQTHETAGKMNLGRTFRLAYFGAAGIASDHVNRVIHLDTLLQTLVRRGERVERNALALVRTKSANVRRVAASRANSHTL